MSGKVVAGRSKSIGFTQFTILFHGLKIMCVAFFFNGKSDFVGEFYSSIFYTAGSIESIRAFIVV
jgi:hypothetical protein